MESPWYRDGLRFRCTQCGQCCSGPGTGYVWVTDDEVRSLAHTLSMEETAFRDRFVRAVGSRQSLVEYPDGDCILLDPQSRRCTAYAARPKQCRTWPFWPANVASAQAWEETCQACPGCDRPDQSRGDLYTLEQVSLIARDAGTRRR
jgi:uncharacterized protein